MTHQLIENWRRMRAIATEAQAAESDAYTNAWDAPLPERLRPATPDDMVEGAIIWYPESPGRFWSEIKSVSHPDDDFKAFVSEDGCRYGLRGAFVEAAS